MGTYDQAIATGERDLKRTFWRATTIGLVFVFIAASMLAYITDESLEATRNSLPVHKLGNDIKTELARYQLSHDKWSGQISTSIAASRNLSLDKLDQHMSLLLEGGQREGLTIIALTRGHLLDQAVTLRADINQLKNSKKSGLPKVVRLEKNLLPI